jgi:NADH dehydrogenase
MKIKKICILGGSGFVGQSLANRLTKDGYELRVLTRDLKSNRHLLLLPTLELVECNIHDQGQLIAQFSSCDAVINLVGILNERGRDGRGFHYVHAGLAEKIIEACRQNSIKRILQMSALNADTDTGTSYYLRSKGEAEDISHAAGAYGIAVTSYRPSVIFGPPVYVQDVAEMMARSLDDPDSHGQRFCLCGPREYTLLDLVRYTAKVKGLKRSIIPLGDTLSRLQATLFDFIPGKPFSTDNYNSAKLDSTCNKNDLSVYDITPTPLESVIPQYLANKHQRARYFEFRSSSQRN